MIHQLEGLAELVFLYQFVDEGNRTDAFFASGNPR